MGIAKQQFDLVNGKDIERIERALEDMAEGMNGSDIWKSGRTDNGGRLAQNARAIRDAGLNAQQIEARKRKEQEKAKHDNAMLIAALTARIGELDALIDGLGKQIDLADQKLKAIDELERQLESGELDPNNLTPEQREKLDFAGVDPSEFKASPQLALDERRTEIETERKGFVEEKLKHEEERRQKIEERNEAQAQLKHGGDKKAFRDSLRNEGNATRSADREREAPSEVSDRISSNAINSFAALKQQASITESQADEESVVETTMKNLARLKAIANGTEREAAEKKLAEEVESMPDETKNLVNTSEMRDTILRQAENTADIDVRAKVDQKTSLTHGSPNLNG